MCSQRRERRDVLSTGFSAAAQSPLVLGCRYVSKMGWLANSGEIVCSFISFLYSIDNWDVCAVLKTAALQAFKSNGLAKPRQVTESIPLFASEQLVAFSLLAGVT